MNPALALDHVVVAARDLAAGVAWCEQTFGVTPEAGGVHPFMATHNRIFSIATAANPRAYFEIIACDPAAAPPLTPRWFGLDEPALQDAIAERPALVHWVARCDDIAAATAALRGQGFDPGTPTAAERATARGVLRWKITVRADGQRLANGAVPALIEWSDVHPSASLAPCGVRLAGARVGGLPDPLESWLCGALQPASNGLQDVDAGPPTIGVAPFFAITLESPRGTVTLDSLHSRSAHE